MEELYTCECRDGRTITGASRWSLYELRNLPPLELAKAVVSDESVPDPFKEFLFKNNIQLYTSLDIPPAMIGTNYL